MARYEVRYGTPVNFKVVKTEYRDRAEGVFDTAKRFAEKHSLSLTVTLWNDGYRLSRKWSGCFFACSHSSTGRIDPLISLVTA